MNNRFYALVGIVFSCVMAASIVGSTSVQSMVHDVQCEPGSVLAKDTRLAALYAQVLSTFTSIQGTAEYMRELDALANWTQLKKGKAPVQFHARLKSLAKKVSSNEWLTDEEKALFSQLVARLSKKKSRVRALPAVMGSLAAVLAVAAIGCGLHWRTQKSSRGGDGDDSGDLGLEHIDNDVEGDCDGGMGYQHSSVLPNDAAILAAGHAVPSAPPGYGGTPGKKPSWFTGVWKQLWNIRAPGNPATGAHSDAFPDAPTAPPIGLNPHRAPQPMLH